MSRLLYLAVTVIVLLASIPAEAQKAERKYIRQGNRQFHDSVFVQAETSYRKAIDVNPKSTVSMYNLANTLLMQGKAKDAMEQYAAVAKMEKDKSKLAQVFHNMGVVFESQKDYRQAIEAYKQSLRNNPKDDETRYNLALCQKLLKDQQSQSQDQQEQQQEQQQQQQDDKQQQQQDQQQQQQNQPKDSQQQDNNMSKENAEQMLKSVMQDERNVQDKVKQQQAVQGGRLEKDW